MVSLSDSGSGTSWSRRCATASSAASPACCLTAAAAVAALACRRDSAVPLMSLSLLARYGLSAGRGAAASPAEFRIRAASAASCRTSVAVWPSEQVLPPAHTALLVLTARRLPTLPLLATGAAADVAAADALAGGGGRLAPSAARMTAASPTSSCSSDAGRPSG